MAYGKSLFIGQNRDDRAFGKVAVTDLTSVDATHPTGLTNREGREVVSEE